jgi:hypothetical protein
MYLALTHTRDGVSGSLTIVVPDKKEGTHSRTLSLHGDTDGNAISLSAENLIFNGRKEKDSILLMFPNDSGIISTFKFSPGSEKEFNEAVTKLRQLILAAIRADQETEKHKKSEKDKLTELAGALENDVLAIKRTGIKADLDDIASALNNEYLAVRQLEEHLAALQRDTSVRPMTCYQAYQTVGYDFNQTLKYDYEQTLGYANSQYKDAIIRLEERLSGVEIIVGKIKQEAQELNQAVKQSKFPLPKLDIMPGDESGALKE